MEMHPDSPLHIVIVGAGPSTTYLLGRLIDAKQIRFRITVIEANDVAGQGEPFSDEGAYPALLANLGKDEIPECPSLNATVNYHSTSSAGREPPVLRKCIGNHFNELFRNALKALRVKGHEVNFKKNVEVSSIATHGNTYRLSTTDGCEHYADKLVLNVGSSYNKREVQPGYFPPYPTFTYSLRPEIAFRILGTSLSAIDATLAIAKNRGTFVRHHGGFTFHTSKLFTVELTSPSAVFPQIFYSTKNQKRYLDSLKKKKLSECETTSEFIHNCFLALLKDYNEPIYFQVRYMTFESMMTFLLGRRQQVDPFQKLKIDTFAAYHTSAPQEQWPAMLEAALLYAEKNIDMANRALGESGSLRKLLHASMASIPLESAEKLLALHRSGNLHITRADRQSHSSSRSEKPDSRCLNIDARGYLNAQDGLKKLTSIIHYKKTENQTVCGKITNYSVSRNQNLLINNEASEIYIGSAYLTPHLLRLPGLDICNSLSGYIYNQIVRTACPKRN